MTSHVLALLSSAVQLSPVELLLPCMESSSKNICWVTAENNSNPLYVLLLSKRLILIKPNPPWKKCVLALSWRVVTHIELKMSRKKIKNVWLINHKLYISSNAYNFFSRNNQNAFVCLIWCFYTVRSKFTFYFGPDLSTWPTWNTAEEERAGMMSCWLCFVVLWLMTYICLYSIFVHINFE
jgi:hypothetical protein